MTLVPTPGQTVGPFFGYALPYDGDSALVPRRPPRRGPAARPRARRRRRPGPGRAARALAGRARRHATRPEPGSLRRDGFDVHRLGPRLDRRRRPLLVLDAGARRAVLRRHGLRARPAQPAVHPRLPPRRTRDDPFLATLDAGPPRRPWSPTADDHGFVLRHPAPGRGRDGVPHLSAAPTVTDRRGIPLLARRPSRRRALHRRDLPRGDARRGDGLARRPGRGGHRAARRAGRPRRPRRGLPRGVAGRGDRGGRQPGDGPGRPAAQRARGRAADRGRLAAPRPHQPGRRRHRADADGPGRRRPAARSTSAARPSGSASWRAPTGARRWSRAP